MEITKRDGRVETFDSSKIRDAIAKAFQGSSVFPSDDKMDSIVASVVQECSSRGDISVEEAQDIVEETLMGYGYYKTAKAYILYREQRANVRQERGQLVSLVGDEGLDDVLAGVQKDYPQIEYSLAKLTNKVGMFITRDMGLYERLSALTKACVELASAEEPKWEFISG